MVLGICRRVNRKLHLYLPDLRPSLMSQTSSYSNMDYIFLASIVGIAALTLVVSEASTSGLELPKCPTTFSFPRPSSISTSSCPHSILRPMLTNVNYSFPLGTFEGLRRLSLRPLRGFGPSSTEENLNRLHQLVGICRRARAWLASEAPSSSGFFLPFIHTCTPLAPLSRLLCLRSRTSGSPQPLSKRT